jgi:hypothetical protein
MKTEQKLLSVLDSTIKHFKLESVANDLYIAGGAIRDLDRDLVPKDYDIYVTNKASAEVVKAALSKNWITNSNENFDIFPYDVGAKLNIILNEEFITSPEKLIKEFNFTCNQNYYHAGKLKKNMHIHHEELVLNPFCKYPLGCLVKIPRMVELGYKVKQELIMQLLGKVLPMNIQTREEFERACPNISGGLITHATGLPNAKQYFDSTELGKSLT